MPVEVLLPILLLLLLWPFEGFIVGFTRRVLDARAAARSGTTPADQAAQGLLRRLRLGLIPAIAAVVLHTVLSGLLALAWLHDRPQAGGCGITAWKCGSTRFRSKL